jgi:hypothetical protein
VAPDCLCMSGIRSQSQSQIRDLKFEATHIERRWKLVRLVGPIWLAQRSSVCHHAQPICHGFEGGCALFHLIENQPSCVPNRQLGVRRDWESCHVKPLTAHSWLDHALNQLNVFWVNEGHLIEINHNLELSDERTSGARMKAMRGIREASVGELSMWCWSNRGASQANR